jgi:hypothetical protein
MQGRILYVLVFAAVGFFLSCEENSENFVQDPCPNEFIPPDFVYTAADSLEAYQMACLTDTTLTPSDAAVADHLYHLNCLRACWSDSVVWLDSIQFVLPWMPGELVVRLDSEHDSLALLGHTSFMDAWGVCEPDFITRLHYSPIWKFHYQFKYRMPKMASLLLNFDEVEYSNINGVIMGAMSFFPLTFGRIDGEWAYAMIPNCICCATDFFRYECGEPMYYGRTSSPDCQISMDVVEDIWEQWFAYYQ